MELKENDWGFWKWGDYFVVIYLNPISGSFFSEKIMDK